MSQEQVEVRMVYPMQVRSFYYDWEEWQFAVENGEVWDLVDVDLSNWTPEVEVHGPDGQIIL